MKKKEEAAVIEAKPQKVPSKTPIEINGKTYDLCFDFAELAKSERLYRSQGHQFNLMFAMPEFTFGSLQVVFPCLVRTHHPELTWEQAQELVTLQSASAIALAVAAALEGASSATLGGHDSKPI
jgi:hypothetical protein